MTRARVRELPDLPRWVEAHGMAADPASWYAAVGDGVAIGHDGAQLIVLAGAVEPIAAVALARAHPTHAVLCEHEVIATALAAARPIARAILHTLPDPAALPSVDTAATAPLPIDAPLAHMPAPLADELDAARARATIWATWLDGEPVSFAYASWRSARWFDVSVETVPAARQLGLATLTAAAMIAAERADGREPVWGADEGNAASRRLAATLGFAAIDELWIAAPSAPSAPSESR